MLARAALLLPASSHRCRAAELHARLRGVVCADKPTASHSQCSSVGSRSTPHVHEQPRDQAPSPIHTRISHRSHGHPPPTSRAPPHPPPTRSVVPFNHGRRAAVHWRGATSATATWVDGRTRSIWARCLAASKYTLASTLTSPLHVSTTTCLYPASSCLPNNDQARFSRGILVAV